ncbi:hypothetical protein AAHC03_02016 [Spirometra sp. Aus1]
MSARVLYERFGDEAAHIQQLISSISSTAQNCESSHEARKQIDVLQSDARKGFSALNLLVAELEQAAHSTAPSRIHENLSNSKNQLLSLQNAYRETVYSALRKLETAERKQLISGSSRTNASEEAKIRDQVLSSLKLTDEMRIHARRLAEEVARGMANAELVDDSSGQFNSNLKGLKDMGGHLQMAGRLGHKLSRRRIADCVLFTLVFLFFYLTCAYIILKRLYFFKLL